jgi:hypothetical protein
VLRGRFRLQLAALNARSREIKKCRSVRGRILVGNFVEKPANALPAERILKIFRIAEDRCAAARHVFLLCSDLSR